MTRMTMARMMMARLGNASTCKNTPRPAADCAAHHLHRATQKHRGARPWRPECQDKMPYYPGVPGLFWLKRRWALVFEVAASAPCANAPTHQRTNVPTYHRIVASVARLQRANGRDRPAIRAVVAHGVITGTFKHATCVDEAGIRIAGYGITGRNYCGTASRCE